MSNYFINTNQGRHVFCSLFVISCKHYYFNPKFMQISHSLLGFILNFIGHHHKSQNFFLCCEDHWGFTLCCILIQDIVSFESIQGKGLKGTLNNSEYFVGNAKLMQDLKLSFDNSKLEQYTAQGKTPVILATKEKVLGFVMVADEIKNESKQAVTDLHKLGIKVIMLTGDDEKAAKYMASLVGIDEVV